MQQKVIKAGNSKVITIPVKFAEALGIKLGDPVKTEISLEKRKLIYTFAGPQQLSLLKKSVATSS